jgi:hypothetical protein
MSAKDSPRALKGVRDNLRDLVAKTSLRYAPHDHGYIKGWINALYWADILSAEACKVLQAEVQDAFAPYAID